LGFTLDSDFSLNFLKTIQKSKASYRFAGLLKDFILMFSLFFYLLLLFIDEYLVILYSITLTQKKYGFISVKCKYLKC